MIFRFFKAVYLLVLPVVNLIFILALSVNYSFCLDFPSKYQNYASKQKRPIGILVVAYNRPDYFQQVIDSLSENPESQSLPFFFFLDGGPQSKQQEIIAIIKKSKIKNKEIIARKSNYGCEKNISNARRFMFDWCGFNKIIYFEDDMIVTPDYIGLTLRLHNWAKNNYDNVGIVQGWFPCKLSSAQKKQNYATVVDTLTHFWGYCMDRDVWQKIRDICYKYEVEYSHWPLNDRAIKDWFKKIYLSSKPRLTFKKPFPTSPLIPGETPGSPEQMKQFFYDNEAPAGWDAVTLLALWYHGYVKISTLVNRGFYIGKEGLHFNSHLWETFFKGVTFEKIPGDKTINKFRPLIKY